MTDESGFGSRTGGATFADGSVLVVGHTGGDDAYGRTDQSIVMDRFRLQPCNGSSAGK